MGIKTGGTRVTAPSTDTPTHSGGVSGIMKDGQKHKEGSSTPKGRATGDTKNSP